MPSVLFVDDEPLVLRALGRMVRPMQSDFESLFATNGAEALDQLAAKPIDVLVSDMRMPGMDGAALLTQAQQHFPATARVILSGYAQDETVLRAIPVSHRFLSKPLQPAELKLVLFRTIALHKILSSSMLRELVGGAKDLPTRPVVYFALRSALADNSKSMRDIARIVERDAGITGRLLRTVNNAFFAPAQRITSVQQAVQHLGTNMLTSLILTLECFGNFEDTLADCDLLPTGLERRSYLAATIARELIRDRVAREDAFVAALLHDCGLLLVAARRPVMLEEAVRVAREESCTLVQAERKVWGTTHAEVGAYLLGLWGLPYPVVEAVANSQSPERHAGPGLDVGVAVYMASAFADAAMIGDVASVMLDADLVARTGLAGTLPELITTVENIISRPSQTEDQSEGPSAAAKPPVH
jgi:HD-like signal output (HDOD) protein/ActR/RegA family two-component response regulator